MRISEKVIKVFKECAHEYKTAHTFPYHHEKYTQAVIQAYLSEIWKPFEQDDESTWPDQREGLLTRSGYTLIDIEPYQWDLWDVTHYLNPADILPQDKDTEK